MSKPLQPLNFVVDTLISQVRYIVGTAPASRTGGSK